MHDIGFVHYWARHDYKSGGRVVQRGSRLPGAAWVLKPLAAVTLAQGGERSTSRAAVPEPARSRATASGCARTRGPAPAAARRHGRHGLAAAGRAAAPGARPRRAGHVARTWCEPAPCAPFPPTPTASSSPWSPRPARRQLGFRNRHLRPLPDESAVAAEAGAAPRDRPRPGARRHCPRRAVPACRSAASSTSASTASRWASRSSIRLAIARGCGQALRWHHNVPVGELAAAARPLRVLRGG